MEWNKNTVYRVCNIQIHKLRQIHSKLKALCVLLLEKCFTFCYFFVFAFSKWILKRVFRTNGTSMTCECTLCFKIWKNAMQNLWVSKYLTSVSRSQKLQCRSKFSAYKSLCIRVSSFHTRSAQNFRIFFFVSKMLPRHSGNLLSW